LTIDPLDLKNGERFAKLKTGKEEHTDNEKKNIYPNSWKGFVGTKFVNIFSDNFLIQISNTQVQTVFREEVQVFSDGLK
jgi:hypothetical protein